MSQLEFDEKAARQLEAVYLIADAVRRRRIVRAALGASAGERVLDVGCGPGFYCAELLEDVGPSGSVVGVDGSPAMLALAARRCAAYANVELLEGDALELPVADASFDAVLSVQVQEYVADAAAASAELWRALRPGGGGGVRRRLGHAVARTSDATGLTGRVLRAWDEHLAHRSLPRTLASHLRAAGFEDVEMTGHSFATLEFDADRYGPALTPSSAPSWPAGMGSRRRGGGGVGRRAARARRARRHYFAIIQFCFSARKPG